MCHLHSTTLQSKMSVLYNLHITYDVHWSLFTNFQKTIDGVHWTLYNVIKINETEQSSPFYRTASPV